jgi:hypothetical protein
LLGRALYYTEIELSLLVLEDLEWWFAFLAENPGNESRSGKAGKLAVTFGDGSGTGTGGTIEWVRDLGLCLEAWMGTWSLEVVHFDSNWKELRTDESTNVCFAYKGLERRLGNNPQASWALSYVHIKYLDSH